MKNCPYSETELLEIAQRFKKNLKYLASSSARIPELDQEFIFRFKARFYEAQAHAHPHPLDSAAERFTLVLTQELDELIDRMRNVFRQFRYNMQKACPYGSELWSNYDNTWFEKALCNHSVFQQFINEFIQYADEKRGELKKSNCPTQDIEEIRDLSREFGQKCEELNEYLERKEIRNKVNKKNLSELYRLMMTINKVAAKNLDSNPEIFKNLLLPPKEPD